MSTSEPELPIPAEGPAMYELVKSGELSVPGDSSLVVSEETLIEYRPFLTLEKWFKYRFSAWSEFKAWFVMTLVVVFFSCGVPGWVVAKIAEWLAGSAAGGAAAAAATVLLNSRILVLYMLMFVTMAVMAAVAVYRSQPTHIGISPFGLRLHWRRRLGLRAGRLTAWYRITHVSLIRPPERTSPQDYWLSFLSGDNDAFRLKLGFIPTQEERSELLAAISEFAPKITRDPEVMEVLAPPHDHSYTELWLQALSAPPKRERLTPLAAGGTLAGGKYTVTGQLGVGGQGTAYLARYEGEDGIASEVVLKESILPVYVDVKVRKQALEDFQKEAVMLRALDHGQIVKLVDYFVEDHRSYLVLEHIDGPSLRGLVQKEGRQKEERVRQLALQMCDILEYLHGLTPPVVHRDFTPDNLILGADGVLKLVDFNVAHQSESTATGTVVGKHAYLPPEQFRGKPTTQSDIYALGATLYYLLIGEDPEPISTSHPVLTRDDLTAEIDDLVARATAVDVRQRFATVGAVREKLL